MASSCLVLNGCTARRTPRRIEDQSKSRWHPRPRMDQQPVHTSQLKTLGASSGEDSHSFPLSDIFRGIKERRVLLESKTDKLFQRFFNSTSEMAPVDNLTCVLHAKGDMRLEQTPIPEPSEGEVQLCIKSTGICGSDVHYLVHGAIGPFVVTTPMILGHETAGVVTKLGPKVTHLKVGDRVAVEPGVTCRQCEDCRSGRYNLCQKVIFCATPPYHGTLRRFYCHEADLCFKLPDSLSFDEGAFMEPLSVAVQACRRADLKFGEKVLVTGAGPIGLLNLLVAKAFGATTIVVTDIVDSKLELVRKLGATGTVNVKGKTNEAIVKEILAITGSAPEVTLECSGVESSVALGIMATRQGGRVVMVGMGPPLVKVPLIEAVIKEIDIRGVFRYANCYPTAIELVASGKVDVKPLITHRFKLEEAAKAFETMRTGAGGAIKVIIESSK